jgi:VanZ family protein
LTSPFWPARTSPRILTAAHYGWLALGLGILTVYGNLIPFRFEPHSWAEALAVFRQIPLIDPADLGARGDWIVSVLLFAALSYTLMGAFCVDRRLPVKPGVALAVAFFCAVLSLAIEFAQIYFPPRTVSLNDIAAETLGGVTGTVLWLAAGQRITQWVRRLQKSSSLAGLVRRLFPGYLVLLLLVQLMPFDFTISMTELAVKYEQGKIWLVPFASLPITGKMDMLANMAGFFPVGFLRALATDRSVQPGRSWGSVLRFGLVLTTLVEFLQLFVYSRACDTTDILTGTVAILLGWKAALAWRAHVGAGSKGGAGGISPLGRMRSLSRPVAGLLFMAWLGGVLYINWKPFDFTTEATRFTSELEDLPVHGIRRMTLLPVVDYYWGSKYQALDQFLRKTVSFLPLGILGACALPRLFTPGATWRVLLTALLVAAVVETGRYFLPSRTPSMTDLLMQGFGAWLGFVVTRHVRTILWAENAFHV